MDMTERSANTQEATGAPDYSKGHAIAVAESFIRGLQAATNIATSSARARLLRTWTLSHPSSARLSAVGSSTTLPETTPPPSRTLNVGHDTSTYPARFAMLHA